MNYIELQEFYKQAFPEKKVSFDFDEKCHREINLIMTDGVPNMVHHIDMDKCCVTIEGAQPVYVSIQSHKMNISWANVLKMMNAKGDVCIPVSDIDALKELQSKPEIYALKMQELLDHTGFSQDVIEAKLK